VGRGAFRPSWIFLAILGLFVFSGALTWRGIGDAGFDVFLFVVAGWLLSLCLHEYAHALTAYKGGDWSVVDRGYLTLNPLKYSHPLLSIVLPVVFVVLGGLGMPGGAVSIERHRLRSRLWDSGVSFAGPAVNVVLTILCVLPFAFGVAIRGERLAFWAGLAFLAFLQLTAALLNLLPIPGVDGGNLIFPYLSPKWQRGFELVAPYGLLVLFGALFIPEVNAVFFLLVDSLAELVGLPQGMASIGRAYFQFWN
jgi:Zn-dependent protease